MPAADRRTQEHNTRLGDAMRRLGWARKSLRIGGKMQPRYWRGNPDGTDPKAQRLPAIYVKREDEGHVMVRAFADGEDEG